MVTTTTIRSWPALAIGASFAGLTGWVLLADVIAGAAMTPGHALSAGAVIAAIASGHYCWPQLRRGAIIPGFLLAVLFFASTSYVVLASAARTAETSGTKAARIADTNAARSRELKQLAMAEGMHRTATGKLDAECVRGKASKGTCDGIRATIAVYDAAVRGHKATLNELGPELAPNGGYAHAARTLAALPGIAATPEQIEERLVLVLPFVTVLISELATIVFLGLAFGHGSNRIAAIPASRAVSPGNTASCPAAIVLPGNDDGPLPPSGNRRRVATKAAAEADVIQLVARGPLPTQETLAKRWGVNSGTACKWLSDFEQRGLIVRHAVGRRKVVAAA